MYQEEKAKMDQDTLNKIDANVAICRGHRLCSQEEHVNGGHCPACVTYNKASRELDALQLLRLGVLVGMGKMRIDDAIIQVLNGGGA